uniref:Uncharacterized protein n=1 Tax=viral metagenome TaxID=1070528 RepID=A0A6M3IHX0_9ZZZZ
MGFFESIAKSAPEALKTSILIQQKDNELKQAKIKEAQRRLEWKATYLQNQEKINNAQQNARDKFDQKSAADALKTQLKLIELGEKTGGSAGQRFVGEAINKYPETQGTGISPSALTEFGGRSSEYGGAAPMAFPTKSESVFNEAALKAKAGAMYPKEPSAVKVWQHKTDKTNTFVGPTPPNPTDWELKYKENDPRLDALYANKMLGATREELLKATADLAKAKTAGAEEAKEPGREKAFERKVDFQEIKHRDAKDLAEYRSAVKTANEKELDESRQSLKLDLEKAKGDIRLDVSKQLKALDEEYAIRKEQRVNQYQVDRENRAFDTFTKKQQLNLENQKDLTKFRMSLNKTELGKLLDERNALEAEDPNRDLYDNIIRSKTLPKMTDNQLTVLALNGDKEAKAVLDAKSARDAAKASDVARSQMDAKLGRINIDYLAQSVIDGRTTIENIKNAFGTPVQPIVMSRVLELSPGFNFNQPKIRFDSAKASMTMLEKQYTSMGSFVENINKQIDRLDKELLPLISRTDVRFINKPLRYLKTTVLGNSIEVKLNMYLAEVSREVARLTAGSPQSIAELTQYSQMIWDAIHDPNLSVPEIRDIMNESKHLGLIRLESVDEQRQKLWKTLENISDIGIKPQASGSPKSNMSFDADALIEKYRKK